jgi:thiol-disulfide isomerase/thioredoxin
MAPDFKAHNVVTGHTAPLSSQRGKVVILTFWASWCAPCRRAVPILEKAQRLLGKDKLTVFAVSFKESQQAAGHLFIIGRDGKVLANHLGYGDSTINELVDDINHALAEPTPAEQQVSLPATDAT